jgi:hypothetical protein
MPKTTKLHPSPKPNPEYSEGLNKIESSWRELLEVGKAGTFKPELIKDLAEVFDKQTDLFEFLLKREIAEADPASVQLLMALNDQVISKRAHKLIKRALYLLEQKGLPVSSEFEQKKGSADSGILKERARPQLYGYLSEFDEGGNRIAAMVLPMGIKGKVFLFVLINTEGEMENFTALEVNKKEAKRILADLEEQTGQPFFEAAPEHTASVIKEAHDRGSHLDQSGEGSWAAILNLLSGLRAFEQDWVIRSLIQPEEGGRMDLPRLLSLPEAARFFIKPELFEPYRQSIKAIQEGVLIVSPEQKMVQIQNIVRKAAEDIFQGEVRNRLIRFFEEAAYLYYLKDQKDQSRLLIQAAHSLEPHPRSGENPYLLWLVERFLLPGQDPSLEPGPKMETTQGGIIIPAWVNLGE